MQKMSVEEKKINYERKKNRAKFCRQRLNASFDVLHKVLGSVGKNEDRSKTVLRAAHTILQLQKRLHGNRISAELPAIEVGATVHSQSQVIEEADALHAIAVSLSTEQAENIKPKLPLPSLKSGTSCQASSLFFANMVMQQCQKQQPRQQLPFPTTSRNQSRPHQGMTSLEKQNGSSGLGVVKRCGTLQDPISVPGTEVCQPSCDGSVSDLHSSLRFQQTLLHTGAGVPPGGFAPEKAYFSPETVSKDALPDQQNRFTSGCNKAQDLMPHPPSPKTDSQENEKPLLANTASEAIEDSCIFSYEDPAIGQSQLLYHDEIASPKLTAESNSCSAIVKKHNKVMLSSGDEARCRAGSVGEEWWSSSDPLAEGSRKVYGRNDSGDWWPLSDPARDDLFWLLDKAPTGPVSPISQPPCSPIHHGDLPVISLAPLSKRCNHSVQTPWIDACFSIKRILMDTFGFLDPQSLLTARAVNKGLSAVALENDLWRHLCQKRFGRETEGQQRFNQLGEQRDLYYRLHSLGTQPQFSFLKPELLGLQVACCIGAPARVLGVQAWAGLIQRQRSNGQTLRAVHQKSSPSQKYADFTSALEVPEMRVLIQNTGTNPISIHPENFCIRTKQDQVFLEVTEAPNVRDDRFSPKVMAISPSSSITPGQKLKFAPRLLELGIFETVLISVYFLAPGCHYEDEFISQSETLEFQVSTPFFENSQNAETVPDMQKQMVRAEFISTIQMNCAVQKENQMKMSS